VSGGSVRRVTSRRWLAFAVGALAGVVLAVLLLRSSGSDEPVMRPRASLAEVAAWDEEGARRRAPLERFPDPPGDGPVTSARYWVSLPAYEMEIRRRGARTTLQIRGTDVQVGGGAWTAFAEGSITGRDGSFRSAVATVVWSCVGLRYRGSTDGVARISFSADGRDLVAVYLQGYEALQSRLPDTYVRAHGRLAVGERPAYGVIRGQVPVTARLARRDDGDVVPVTGRVVDLDGNAVPDALVQLKGLDATRVHADARGRFALRLRGADAPWTASICAGAAGHRNGETVLFTGDATEDVVVELARLDLTDHDDYRWVHPSPTRDPDDVQACGTCHSWQYTEWLGSRHARAADHGHVWFHRERMRRRAPEAPDDCAACHQPGYAATTRRGDYQPRGLIHGNHCDVCHKATHVRDPSKPGVFGSLVLARPSPTSTDRPGDIHRVFGPAPDVSFAYMGASYAPAQSTSWFCAGCHQGGGLAGRPKVDTFEEWRAWARGREDESFRSCQDCHMPGGVTRDAAGAPIDLVAWESLHRKPGAVHAHGFPGPAPSLARDALAIEVEKRFDAGRGRWLVVVRATNRGAGHAIPTGTWTKHVALGIWARQGDRWLAADGGERAALVDEAAPAALAGGDWRNPPGTVFGVRRSSGGLATPPDFYDPPPPAETVDARLAAGATRTVEASFVPVGDGPGEPPEVEVRVIHRRGTLGATAADVPWDLRPNDPPPQVEWLRIVR
jgi:hypothetical protein